MSRSIMHTVTPWQSKLLNAVQWALLALAATCLVLSVVVVIANLKNHEAELDTAFLQGMKAGSQLCPRGQ